MVIWVFLTTGFTLAAKLTMHLLVKILVKLLSIGAAIYVILDLLKIQY